MIRFRPARALGAFALLFPALAAQACTVCDSPTGHQVRAGLFNGHFLHTSLLVAAPFPVFAALLVLLHFGMPDLEIPHATSVPGPDPEPLPLAHPELAL